MRSVAGHVGSGHAAGEAQLAVFVVIDARTWAAAARAVAWLASWAISGEGPAVVISRVRRRSWAGISPRLGRRLRAVCAALLADDPAGLLQRLVEAVVSAGVPLRA
jgi:hypothetical protein